MDLIGGYLIVMLVLFTGNIALLMGNIKINNLKLIATSILFSIVVFIILNVSVYLNIFIVDYFSYIFLIISLILFFVIFYFIRNNNFKLALYSVLALFIISLTLFCSQTSLNYLEMILYSLCVFIILFVVYQLSKLLHHAKRQYSVIIGEYMCLFSILTLIFALTYNSTLNLDYSMFSPFLILTPTYQLIYVIIAIIAVLVIGVFINDSKGGNS
ncbi:peptide ABC transporter permease [Methanobrevibacter sp. UBA188]|uniref:peptide ABC transporter permease n=1 Tax=unclassified Methanobrevibacter TaxID=2638681 RepID=UPI0025D94855|nr:peptide ABC transporter permease [Methanobrevibacter sp. UBA188]